MGYIRNEAIIVSGWSPDCVMRAHEAAVSIFDACKLGSLVSGVVHHAINGGAAFFIASDGSKEGWELSDRAAAARAEFIDFLKSPAGKDCYLDWSLILLGGDDGEFSVIEAPGQERE